MDSPDRIGKYEILSILGRGGMGVVYRAQDPTLARQVAIKTVTEGLSKDAGMLQRFYREAEKMGMLKHQNIITVYELGEQDGCPYIVMEYIEGLPLDHIIKSDRDIPLIFKLRIVEQVCSALGYAHQHDVVHRDVKPANVIVRPDGVAKLLDFGIARQERSAADLAMTANNAIIGTIPYMAPERLKGAPLDGRSDIFAAGVMLYQLLTGNLPFLGEEVVLINRILNERPAPLSEFVDDYPKMLDAIVDRSLEKHPHDRYQIAEDMATDLCGVIEVLKAEYATEAVARAEALVGERKFAAARDVLLELLRIDSQHKHGRRFLAEVNQHLTVEMRMEEAQQKLRLAKDAARRRQFDEAIQLLGDAAKLVPGDVAIAEQLAEVLRNKEISDQILGYLRRAEAAKKAGDYQAAQSIVEKALQLDSNNSRLRSAYLSLIRQAEEVAQRAKVTALLVAARKELDERRFHGALKLLKEAGDIAPANPEVLSLGDAAQEGLVQEERRRLLDEIEALMTDSMTQEEIARVSPVLQKALEKIPTDPTLLRFHAQIDDQIRRYARKELVEVAVKECLTLLDILPLKALDIVRKTLVQAPGDDRLLGIKSTIEDRLARQTEQETRDGILLQAREALTERRFADAVVVLEQCRGPIRTTEVTQLLEFAREQAQKQEEQAMVAACYAAASTLQAEGKDEAVVELIKPVLRREDDAGLRKLMAEAQERIDRRRAGDEEAMQTVRNLMDEGCYDQAIAFIGGVSERLTTLVGIPEILADATRLRELEWSQMERLGMCYAMLGAANPLGPDVDERSCGFDPAVASTPLVAFRSAFEARQTETINRALEERMKSIQTAALPRNTFIDDGRLTVDAGVLKRASDDVRNEWLFFVSQREPAPVKLLSRLTGKRK